MDLWLSSTNWCLSSWSPLVTLSTWLVSLGFSWNFRIRIEWYSTGCLLRRRNVSMPYSKWPLAKVVPSLFVKEAIWRHKSTRRNSSKCHTRSTVSKVFWRSSRCNCSLTTSPSCAAATWTVLVTWPSRSPSSKSTSLYFSSASIAYLSFEILPIYIAQTPISNLKRCVPLALNKRKHAPTCRIFLKRRGNVMAAGFILRAVIQRWLFFYPPNAFFQKQKNEAFNFFVNILRLWQAEWNVRVL